jgi:hypothetical protein
MWRPIETAPENKVILLKGETKYGDEFNLSAQKIKGVWYGHDMATRPNTDHMIPTHWLDLENPELMNAGENDYPDESLLEATLYGPSGYTMEEATQRNDAINQAAYNASVKK